MKYKIFKRAFDIIFSTILILILWPLIFIISIIALIISGKPIFFVQERAGKNGKPFKIFKFRTMLVNAQKLQAKGKTNYEVSTRFGKIFRPLHLDELPQLFNVFNGSMSFVGYRPLLVKDYLNNTEISKEVSTIKPGVSGLMTVLSYLDNKTKSHIIKEYKIKSFEKRLNNQYINKINLYYKRNMNLILDTKIIFWTLLVISEQFIKLFKRKK
jgi:lipopolysaccharide/colanic/teichoic acid biosynthesis glycosyltransferase